MTLEVRAGIFFNAKEKSELGAVQYEREEGERKERKRKEREERGKNGEEERGENTQKSPKPELSAILGAIHLFLHSTNMCGYLNPRFSLYLGIKTKNTVSGHIESIIY